MMDVNASIICCTPSYAAYIGESLNEQGYKPEDIPLKAGIFGAEPWTEEMRKNIEATLGTATFLKENGIKTRVRRKISDGYDDIPETIRQGHIAYVINRSSVNSASEQKDGHEIRKLAIENNVSLFTALDTVRVLLDVLEDITITISTIDS
jgi:hypothetical protein